MRKVLIIGKSGLGKSTSLRTLDNAFIIKCCNKDLPYKANTTQTIWTSSDYAKIKQQIVKALDSGIHNFVLDDVGYLITDYFMKNHGGQTGNGMFNFYNKLADQFYDLIDFIENVGTDEDICYFIGHTETNEDGTRKFKTIGKLLDDKVIVEGRFTIVLEAQLQNGEYKFLTNTDGLSPAKSPMGLFDTQYIDNDLGAIDKRIKEYYKGE